MEIKITDSHLDKLTETVFFQLLSKNNNEHLNEKEFESAYRDFFKTVVKLCINSNSNPSVYFSLEYMRIELTQFEQQLMMSKKKCNDFFFFEKRAITCN